MTEQLGRRQVLAAVVRSTHFFPYLLYFYLFDKWKERG
jgi:hypothetical protein